MITYPTGGTSTFGTPTTPVTGSQTTGNPLQPVYQGAPPQVAPTTSNFTPSAATSGADVSPNSALSQFTSANALSNAQAQNNLRNLLAAQGVSGNDAVQAQGALSGQLTAAQAPALANLISQAQGLGLNQSEFNASANNALNPLGIQQSEFNASAGNQANLANLGATMGVNQSNQNAANNAGTNLAQLLQQTYGLDLSSFTNLLNAGLGGQQSINNAGVNGQMNLANNTANAQNANTANNWQSLGLLAAGLGG